MRRICLVPMKPWQGSLGAELRHEVAVVQRLAPGLPIALPPGKPNTRPAIEQAVALLRRDQALGMAFVRETYRAFWCEGKDISDPAVLRQLVEQVGGSPEDVGTINGEDRRIGSRMGSGLALNRPGRGSPDGLVGGISPCRLRTLEDVRRFFD